MSPIGTVLRRADHAALGLAAELRLSGAGLAVQCPGRILLVILAIRVVSRRRIRHDESSSGRLLSQPWFYATAGAILVWLIIVTHSAGAGGGAVISGRPELLRLLRRRRAGADDCHGERCRQYRPLDSRQHHPRRLSLDRPDGGRGRRAGTGHRRRVWRAGARSASAMRSSSSPFGSRPWWRRWLPVWCLSPSPSSIPGSRLPSPPPAGGVHHGSSVRRSLCHAGRARRLGHPGYRLAAIGLRALAVRLRPERGRGLALRNNVLRTRVAAYVLCGVFTALAGVLFAGFVGGPSLNMGSEFLLSSIAVVVIGGTNVAGGQASVLGTWSASLFLFLLLSMLNVFQVDPGLRNVITGVLIIAVLALNKTNRMQQVCRNHAQARRRPGRGHRTAGGPLRAAGRARGLHQHLQERDRLLGRDEMAFATTPIPAARRTACLLGSDGLVYIANCPTAATGSRRTSFRPASSVRRPRARWRSWRRRPTACRLDGANDLCFGPDGRLYFTDSGDWAPQTKASPRPDLRRRSGRQRHISSKSSITPIQTGSLPRQTAASSGSSPIP